MVLRHKTTIGTEVGAAPIRTMTTLGVEKIYKALKKGTRVKVRLRQANLCMIRMGQAWEYMFARYPNLFPAPPVNPFRAIKLKHGKGTTKPASRAEAYALHRALIAAGEPHLAAVPLICHEWHQRPGHLARRRCCVRRRQTRTQDSEGKSASSGASGN
jgi:hypothetical protein